VRERALGWSGPMISVIGLGAWEAGGTAWGSAPSDEQVIAAMRAGFDAGITWIDTAEVYGPGRSEELVGRAIEGLPHVMVFTKVGSSPRGSGYRPEQINAAVRASLHRLGREVIDLYQLHWPDEGEAPLEDAWAAMGDLVDAGLVRWIGVSNFTRDQLERCERIRHVDSLQPQLSMLWQERLPLLPVCERNGTGVIVYGPLAYGLLGGGVTRATRFPPDDWRAGGHGLRAYDQLFAPERLDANLAIVDALRPIAVRTAGSLARLALAWVLSKTGVTGAIAGSRSPEHVRENAEASSVNLSRDELQEIDLLLRGRGELMGPGDIREPPAR
jgi:aryl-alcohol dehydrogenase-like predicted oxidoreductase